MVDNFALLVSHGILLFVIFYLFRTPDPEDPSSGNPLRPAPGARPRSAPRQARNAPPRRRS